jgi:hypothetical protein
LLHSFGSVSDNQNDLSNYWLIPESQIFHRRSGIGMDEPVHGILRRWGNYIITDIQEQFNPRLLIVADNSGREVYRNEYISSTIEDDCLILTIDGGHIILDHDLNETFVTVYEFETDKTASTPRPVSNDSWEAGNFFVSYEQIHDMRSDARAVYDLDGNLLLDNILGYIWDVYHPDGMFVYLDANTCVLLYPDGRTVPVPNAPYFELEYWG